VSAKSGDGSVIRAIKLFVRHIMERRGKLTRRWQPKIFEEKEVKSRDRSSVTLQPVGIEQVCKLIFLIAFNTDKAVISGLV
jgi:hypothetical protein